MGKRWGPRHDTRSEVRANVTTGEVELVTDKIRLYMSTSAAQALAAELLNAARAVERAGNVDKKPRAEGCTCHQEEGDSSCPVHGEVSE